MDPAADRIDGFSDDELESYHVVDEPQAPDDELSSIDGTKSPVTQSPSNKTPLSPHQVGFGRSTHAPATPVTTTAVQKADPPEEDDQADTVEQILQHQSPTHSVRVALTYLLCLLVPACLLSLVAVPAYHLLLLTMWIVLLALFAGLVWFVQTDVIRRRALHPYLHAAYDAVVREYHEFVSDWRQHVLMLTNDESMSPVEEETNDEAGPKKRNRPKIKSKVFKVVVKPFLPLLERRKRKANKESKPDVQEVVIDEGYIRAPDGSALV